MFSIQQKAGTLNKVADALSQKACLLSTMRVEVKRFDSFKDLYIEDPYFGSVSQEVMAGQKCDYSLVNGFLFKRLLLCIPYCSLREKIMKELHEE